jgi:hypothetical protein
MKSILICPVNRPEVRELSEECPLSNLPILGKTLLEYWIEHLVLRGAHEIHVLATDRPGQARALVGDGSRWGVRVTVSPERRELDPQEARRRYRGEGDGWLPDPEDVTVMDHLPGFAEFPLFTSYADFVAAIKLAMPQAATPDRIGLREVQPGVWAGLHARLSPKARLRAPCWIGDDVFVGPDAVIGPGAVLEKGSLVERGAEIVHSVIGVDTFVGRNVDVRHSIALGGTLVNWKLNSAVTISDPFLLSSVAKPKAVFKPVGILSRVMALVALLVTSPLALNAMIRSKLRGLNAFSPLLAVRSGQRGALRAGNMLVYHELSHVRGVVRRWPQFWNIVRGEFGWVGNRPLNLHQAGKLANDFERLWLAGRPGLISLADTESGSDVLDDQARACSSYYSAHASRWLNCKIILRALFLLCFGISVSRAREAAWRILNAVIERKAY